ncbi:hypothetical protein MBLNU13_g10473t2 [Cladosporium sp. NU13]
MPPYTSPEAEMTMHTSYSGMELFDNARAFFGPVINKHYNIMRATSDSEHIEQLRWLSNLTFQSTTHDKIRQRAGILKRNHLPEHGNSYGKWLLESTQFCQWRDEGLQKLWYVGMPGAGKSVLASIIVDNLTKVQTDVQRDHAPKVACLYFKYDQRKNYSLELLLGGILYQIVEGGLQDLLYEVVKESRGVYLVIDALDECPPELRCSLFKLLPDETKLRILVTSRYLNESRSVAEGFTTTIIRADKQDLDIFIDERLSQFPLLRSLDAKNARQIIQLVKLRVIDKCGGIFLIAERQMQLILESASMNELHKSLECLPTTLEEDYKRTFERINSKTDKWKDLAIETLCWVVFSRRRLTIHELRHALATTPRREFSKDDLYDASVIRESCLGLLSIAEDTQEVSLAHLTMQSYFQHRLCKLFPSFDAKIAQVCIAHLVLGLPEQPSSTGSPAAGTRHYELDAKCSEYPLIRYATTYLRWHLNQLNSVNDELSHVVTNPLNKLLGNDSNRRFLLSLFRYVGVDFFVRDPYHVFVDRSWWTWPPSKFEPSLSFDETDFNREQNGFISEDSGSLATGSDDADSLHEDEMCWTPDAYTGDDAASAGTSEHVGPDTEVTANYSDADSDSDFDYQEDQEDYRLFTALQLAAYFGWAPTVAHYAKAGSDIDAQNLQGQTALMIAVEEAQWSAVNVLLENGARVDLCTHQGRDVLVRCGLDKQFSKVSELLQHDLQLDQCISKSMWDNDLLWFVAFVLLTCSAIWNRSMQAFYRGAATNSEYGLSANQREFPLTCAQFAEMRIIGLNARLLHATISGDCGTIGRLALNKRFDTSTDKAALLEVALFLAVASGDFGRTEVVEALVNIGADVARASILGGSTLLHEATKRNDPEMVKFLLDNGADVEARDSQALNALERHGKGVPNALYKTGESPLYVAAAGGHVGAVAFFLKRGTDPSIRTPWLWTPLHWAAANGQLSCVLKLLDAGADVSALSDDWQTPLDKVKGRSDRVEIEQVLRERGGMTGAQMREQMGGNSYSISSFDVDL